MLSSTPQLLRSSGNPHDLQQLDVDEVAVPTMQFKPCDNLLTLLNTQIDPLQPSNGFAYNLYDLAVQVVGAHLALNCTLY